MIDLGDDGVWECGSTSSEESVAPPPPPLLLCTCGVRLPGAEMSQHLLSDWHRFNLKRKTASPRERALLTRMRHARRHTLAALMSELPDGLTVETLHSWSLNVWHHSEPELLQLTLQLHVHGEAAHLHRV